MCVNTKKAYTWKDCKPNYAHVSIYVYVNKYIYSDLSQTFRRFALKKVGDFNKTDNLFLSQKRKCAYTRICSTSKCEESFETIFSLVYTRGIFITRTYYSKIWYITLSQTTYIIFIKRSYTRRIDNGVFSPNHKYINVVTRIKRYDNVR